MRKTLIFLTAVLIMLGLILTAAALFATDFTFDFFQSGTVQKTVEITEDFQNIAIDLDTSDVYFLPSLDGSCKVYLTETEQQYHNVFVRDDTLTVNYLDDRSWYEDLFGANSMTVEIYLPRSRYVSLHCEADTGDLQMPSAFFFSMAEAKTDTGDIDWHANLSGKLELTTDTGNIKLLDVQAGYMELRSDTGSIEIINTTTLAIMEITTDTGDVTFDRADGESIHVETDTGDVTGTFLTEKRFRGESDTGKVEVPWDTNGGSCIVISDTGDIKLSVAQ